MRRRQFATFPLLLPKDFGPMPPSAFAQGSKLLAEIEGLSRGRVAAHAVAIEAQRAFQKGNEFARVPTTQAAAVKRYSVAIRGLAGIETNLAEDFHACGFDADLKRALIMREKASGGNVTELVSSNADLFCGQDIVPLGPDSELVKTSRKAKAKISSLFLDWSQASPLSSVTWTQHRDKVVLAIDAHQHDADFVHCKGRFHAVDRWKIESSSHALLDSKWGFGNDFDAALFLSKKYSQMSQGLPLLKNSLAVGTDSVVYGGRTQLPDGQLDAQVMHLFRERNLVFKFLFSSRAPASKSHLVLDSLFRKTRVQAYLHAMKTRQLAEDSPYTDAGVTEESSSASSSSPSWLRRIFS